MIGARRRGSQPSRSSSVFVCCQRVPPSASSYCHEPPPPLHPARRDVDEGGTRPLGPPVEAVDDRGIAEAGHPDPDGARIRPEDLDALDAAVPLGPARVVLGVVEHRPGFAVDPDGLGHGDDLSLVGHGWDQGCHGRAGPSRRERLRRPLDG